MWSWDITKLKGPNKGQFFNLYVILDIFSRAVVGWLLAEHENAALAARLIAETCKRHGIRSGTLTIHADRGALMTATSTALLLASLGVGKSHSRPHQSNDNPFSESQFKTMKYHPTFPERFGSIQDARAEAVRHTRQAVLDQALQRHPQRFVCKPPQTPDPPNAVWINPPAQRIAA
ncbi:Integrase core domain-containing protein [Magnetospirillum fulvum]|uniref:Integrase core domain-containing protein n=1 Tax=Magnetospirillum fulvum TaxID=1082 RepID=A0A1H6JJY5_MAGFU|nr:Integrase core domain-containing protein [Magnetospirillum fulvum]